MHTTDSVHTRHTQIHDVCKEEGPLCAVALWALISAEDRMLKIYTRIESIVVVIVSN